MADRNAPASFTFEEWRVEFNELAVDVGDIANLPSTVNGVAVTDVIEALKELESSLSGNMNANIILFGDSSGLNSERIKFGTDDDLQIYHDSLNSYVNHTGTGDLILRDNGVDLTFPGASGTIAVEGFAIALAVALG
jgi:hypothetical protein